MVVKRGLLTLRDEHKFKMFEKSELRNACESKGDEIIT
jgi:hypothetical protein